MGAANARDAEETPARPNWPIVAIALVIVALGLPDCIGLVEVGGSNPSEADTADLLDAGPQPDPSEASAEAEPRPASVDICLAFMASQAFEEARAACEMAMQEDGGVDVAVALGELRRVEARGQEPERERQAD